MASKIARLSLGTALLSIPLVLLDPLLSGFASMAAIIAAGASCSGKNSMQFVLPALAIAFSSLNILFLGHVHAGVLHSPTKESLLEIGRTLSIPLIPAIIMVAIGILRRRMRKLP